MVVASKTTYLVSNTTDKTETWPDTSPHYWCLVQRTFEGSSLSMSVSRDEGNAVTKIMKTMSMTTSTPTMMNSTWSWIS